MATMPGLSDDDGKLLIADTLRLYVGQGRRFSWADLGAATGDDPRKLRSYVEQDPPAMPVPVFMRVFAVLPDSAFGRIATRMGFSPPGRSDADDSVSVRRAITEASRLVTEGNEALEDGALDHVERERLAARAAKLMPMLSVVAGGKP